MRIDGFIVTRVIAAWLFLSASACIAADEENLKALATPECEVPGLSVAPPVPWYSVPIDSAEPTVEGCQMIWERGDQYMGIMRLVAFDAGGLTGRDVKWENLVIAFESSVMAQMNVEVLEPIWKRDTVPVAGDGFSNAKAIGFAARLQGVAHANEAHFLLFESATHKYVISLLTPAESASPEIYDANTHAMGAVMRTLQAR